jgi:hypothetical protein
MPITFGLTVIRVSFEVVYINRCTGSPYEDFKKTLRKDKTTSDFL